MTPNSISRYHAPVLPLAAPGVLNLSPSTSAPHFCSQLPRVESFVPSLSLAPLHPPRGRLLGATKLSCRKAGTLQRQAGMDSNLPPSVAVMLTQPLTVTQGGLEGFEQ